MRPNEHSPQTAMMRYILDIWISKPIYVAAKLNIADLLSDGPKHIDQLASLAEVDPPLLYRLLRALACVGIFTEIGDGKFGLTPMGSCLQSDALRPIALMMHSDWHGRAWEKLLEGIQTGEKPFDIAHGMPIWAWFEDHPEAQKVFNRANAIKAVVSHSAIVDAYDFSGICSLTDIGGGSGALLFEILKANPHMNGVVAELPSVVVAAAELIRNNGFEARCKAVACDFLKQIPGGSEAYLMSHILHDWNDNQCRIILHNCAHAMKPDSRLLVVESLIPPGNQFSIAKLLDLEVFVMGGGRERTEHEFQLLFEAAGFEVARVIPTDDGISIIEGIRLTGDC